MAITAATLIDNPNLFSHARSQQNRRDTAPTADAFMGTPMSGMVSKGATPLSMGVATSAQLPTRRDEPRPMVPNAGQWGEYHEPVDDAFTGTRNGVNYFRGHVWGPEGLAQGGGTGTVQSYAFMQWLVHHLPMLLGDQGRTANVSASERTQLSALIRELTGQTVARPGSAAPGVAMRPLASPSSTPTNSTQTPPMVPNAGQWGDYQKPVGDGFTGTRNGVNYFRGHVWGPEGLAQGGGSGTVQSFAFSQWLRHHLPMLLGEQGKNAQVSPEERARLSRLVAELG